MSLKVKALQLDRLLQKQCGLAHAISAFQDWIYPVGSTFKRVEDMEEPFPDFNTSSEYGLSFRDSTQLSTFLSKIQKRRNSTRQPTQWVFDETNNQCQYLTTCTFRNRETPILLFGLPTSTVMWLIAVKGEEEGITTITDVCNWLRENENIVQSASRGRRRKTYGYNMPKWVLVDLEHKNFKSVELHRSIDEISTELAKYTYVFPTSETGVKEAVHELTKHGHKFTTTGARIPANELNCTLYATLFRHSISLNLYIYKTGRRLWLLLNQLKDQHDPLYCNESLDAQLDEEKEESEDDDDDEENMNVETTWRVPMFSESKIDEDATMYGLEIKRTDDNSKQYLDNDLLRGMISLKELQEEVSLGEKKEDVWMMSSEGDNNDVNMNFTEFLSGNNSGSTNEEPNFLEDWGTTTTTTNRSTQGKQKRLVGKRRLTNQKKTI